MKQERAEKRPTQQSAPRVTGDNNGMYKTVGKEMRTLHSAVEGTAGDKWTVIRRSALSGRFENTREK